jgi:hypothetical protein
MRVPVICAIGLLLLSWLQLLAAAPGFSGTNADLTAKFVADELLVKFKSGVSDAAKAAALQKGKGSKKERLSKTTVDELMLVKMTGNTVANGIKVSILPVSSSQVLGVWSICNPSGAAAANWSR